VHESPGRLAQLADEGIVLCCVTTRQAACSPSAERCAPSGSQAIDA